MPTTLIIDSEIAARDMPSLFGNQWNWPITQSQYDQPITDFIEWSDELHNEISNSEQLLAAERDERGFRSAGLQRKYAARSCSELLISL